MKISILTKSKIYAQRNFLLKKRDRVSNVINNLSERILFLAHKPSDGELKKALFIEDKLEKKLHEFAKLTDEIKYKNKIIYEIERKAKLG